MEKIRKISEPFHVSMDQVTSDHERKLEAEIAKLKKLLKDIRTQTSLKMDAHFSFGPERLYKRIDEALAAEDYGHALEIEQNLRNTLHKIGTYSAAGGNRPSQDEMVEMAHKALSWKPK